MRVVRRATTLVRRSGLRAPQLAHRTASAATPFDERVFTDLLAVIRRLLWVANSRHLRKITMRTEIPVMTGGEVH